MQSPGELRQMIEALQDRISKLSAAILRTSVSLDVGTGLQEIVERPWSLSEKGEGAGGRVNVY